MSGGRGWGALEEPFGCGSAAEFSDCHAGAEPCLFEASRLCKKKSAELGKQTELKSKKQGFRSKLWVAGFRAHVASPHETTLEFTRT